MRGSSDMGRGGVRGTGERSSLRPSFRETGTVRPTTLSEGEKIHRAADMVRERAHNHYEKHRESWVAKHYTRLLLKSAPTLSLTPMGVRLDPKSNLMQRARQEVAHKQVKRLAGINQARTSLINTGKLRTSRDLQWGDKQKETAAPAPETGKPSTTVRENSREQHSTNAKVATAQDGARRKAEAHLVKHQEKWTGKRFEQLTSAFGLSNGMAPKWASQHIRDVAMEVANRGVSEKHEARLQRIDLACDRMRTTGAVRESRAMGRNLGLGE